MTRDPVEARLEAEARADHARAQRRGERLRNLTDAAIGELVAEGLLPAANTTDARVTLFAVLADHLYGTVAIDIPPLRKE